MFEKFKSLLADDVVFGAILLVLVGILSFGLGRLSVSVPIPQSGNSVKNVQLLATSSPLLLRPLATSTVNVAAAVLTVPPEARVLGPYVASKSGAKYYLTTCSGAKRIKDENRVYFATAHDALAAGYEPASTCPGL